MAGTGRHRQRRLARHRRLRPIEERTPLDEQIRQRIAQTGPISFADLVDVALYDPEHGFYTTHGHAGRRGDFITSPEVGPLFGHVVANAIDAEWRRLGSPARFVVIDWGAGPGTLLRAIRAAKPACSEALELVAVERSAEQRSMHPDGVTSLAELTDDRFANAAGVVIANELLDNLAFGPMRRVDALMAPELVDVDASTGELTLRVEHAYGADLGTFSNGAERAVDQTAAAEWLRRARSSLASGRVICIDYARARSDEVRIRTYAEHGDAGDPLDALGTKDVTVDVDLFQLQARVRSADALSTQAEWLATHGIAGLVEEGRRIWNESAATGSLAALKARSRIREAEALLDPAGLGGFTVMEWVI